MEYEFNTAGRTERMVRKKEIFVVSDTLKTVQVSTLLEKVGLLQKFTSLDENNSNKHVIGIDHEFMSESVSKNMAVFKIMQFRNYVHDQMLYVDNIKSMIEYFNSISLCRTIYVNEEYGIGETTCDKIEKMFEKQVATTQLTLELHSSLSYIDVGSINSPGEITDGVVIKLKKDK